VFDIRQGHTDRLGGGPQGIDLGAGPQQGVTGKPEQAAVTLGLHHLVCGETEVRQVFDQTSPLARVGDSGGLKRFQIQRIDHLDKSASQRSD
jgi:hypothetical protein